MTDDVGQFGAGLLQMIMIFAGLMMSAWVADRVYKQVQPPPPDDPRLPYRESNRGCMASLAAFVLIFGLLALLFGPSMGALNRYRCQGSPYFDECVRGSD